MSEVSSLTSPPYPNSLEASHSAPHQPIPMLDLARQFAVIRDEVMQAIDQVCASQNFILGPTVAAFEQSAALLCGASDAIGCASGTDALWLALAAARIGSGDSPSPAHRAPEDRRDAVITTPFSFFSSASSILRAGARPVFADIDPLTFNLSPQRVAEALGTPTGKAVRALLPVHLFGQCADWDAFSALQTRHPGLLLIEDAAQAFGGAWLAADGTSTPAGSLGAAAAFSFYPTKNLSAFGDAGLLTTRSSEIAERARMLRAHGMRKRYFHDEVGWNSRLDSLQAAVLQVKLRFLPGWNQARRERAARYNELFLASSLGTQPTPDRPSTIADGIVLPYTHPRARHVFHQYVIRAPRRDELRAHLTAQGIGSEIYYPLPLHLQPALAFLGYKAGDFPEAERAAGEVLALPIYPELREDEQETVVEAIRAFYAGT